MLYNNLIYLIKVKIKRKRLFSHCTTCFQVLCPDLEALELLTAHICTCASSCLCLSPQASWSKPSQGWCLFLRTQSCSLPLSSNSHTGKAERNSSSEEHNQSPPDCLSFPKDINQGRHSWALQGFEAFGTNSWAYLCTHHSQVQYSEGHVELCPWKRKYKIHCSGQAEKHPTCFAHLSP